MLGFFFLNIFTAEMVVLCVHKNIIFNLIIRCNEDNTIILYHVIFIIWKSINFFEFNDLLERHFRALRCDFQRLKPLAIYRSIECTA